MKFVVKHHLLKYLGFLVGLVATLVALFFLLDWTIRTISPAPTPEYGVTFSLVYTKELNLDFSEVYLAILDDLEVKKIRLPIYWDKVEPVKDQYDFTIYDRLLDLAKQKGVQVTLAIGYKVPRWPECFSPSWAKNLSQEEHQAAVLNLLNKTVEHFKNRPEIYAWQVENEPLLNFGKCSQKITQNFLNQEVELVRSLDSRPVIQTESGELRFWGPMMRKSDFMGSSLYRKVWNKSFGHLNYFYPALYYRLKSFFTQTLVARNNQGAFISELQAEPWPPGVLITELPIPEQMKILSPQDFQGVIEFAKDTHLSPQYLWGVEWWYWMKTQGYPQYWEGARGLFK